MPMSIRVPAGTLVRYANPQNGTVFDRAAASVLAVGQEYTVQSVHRGAWSSAVRLVEHPANLFNTVLFEEVTDDHDTQD